MTFIYPSKGPHVAGSGKGEKRNKRGDHAPLLPLRAHALALGKGGKKEKEEARRRCLVSRRPRWRPPPRGGEGRKKGEGGTRVMVLVLHQRRYLTIRRGGGEGGKGAALATILQDSALALLLAVCGERKKGERSRFTIIQT